MDLAMKFQLTLLRMPNVIERLAADLNIRSSDLIRMKGLSEESHAAISLHSIFDFAKAGGMESILTKSRASLLERVDSKMVIEMVSSSLFKFAEKPRQRTSLPHKTRQKGLLRNVSINYSNIGLNEEICNEKKVYLQNCSFWKAIRNPSLDTDLYVDDQIKLAYCLYKWYAESCASKLWGNNHLDKIQIPLSCLINFLERNRKPDEQCQTISILSETLLKPESTYVFKEKVDSINTEEILLKENFVNELSQNSPTENVSNGSLKSLSKSSHDVLEENLSNNKSNEAECVKMHPNEEIDQHEFNQDELEDMDVEYGLDQSGSPNIMVHDLESHVTDKQSDLTDDLNLADSSLTAVSSFQESKKSSVTLKSSKVISDKLNSDKKIVVCTTQDQENEFPRDEANTLDDASSHLLSSVPSLELNDLTSANDDNPTSISITGKASETASSELDFKFDWSIYESFQSNLDDVNNRMDGSKSIDFPLLILPEMSNSTSKQKKKYHGLPLINYDDNKCSNEKKISHKAQNFPLLKFEKHLTAQKSKLLSLPEHEVKLKTHTCKSVTKKKREKENPERKETIQKEVKKKTKGMHELGAFEADLGRFKRTLIKRQKDYLHQLKYNLVESEIVNLKQVLDESEKDDPDRSHKGNMTYTIEKGINIRNKTFDILPRSDGSSQNMVLDTTFASEFDTDYIFGDFQDDTSSKSREMSFEKKSKTLSKDNEPKLDQKQNEPIENFICPKNEEQEEQSLIQSLDPNSQNPYCSRQIENELNDHLDDNAELNQKYLSDNDSNQSKKSLHSTSSKTSIDNEQQRSVHNKILLDLSEEEKETQILSESHSDKTANEAQAMEQVKSSLEPSENSQLMLQESQEHVSQNESLEEFCGTYQESYQDEDKNLSTGSHSSHSLQEEEENKEGSITSNLEELANASESRSVGSDPISVIDYIGQNESSLLFDLYSATDNLGIKEKMSIIDKLQTALEDEMKRPKQLLNMITEVQKMEL